MAARLADIPPWQVGLFAIAWALAVTLCGVLLPLVVPIFREVDEGLMVGGIALALATFAVIGIHLLVAEGSEVSRTRQRGDPMDLLPVPAHWSFYLSVVDETLTDPAALLIVPPALLGIVLASRTRWLSLALAFLVGPMLMAVLAAVRITATHAARAIVPPRLARVIVRGITYVSLLITVGVGGTLVYDVFTFSRHTAEGIEPLNLMSTTVALGLHDGFVAHPLAARATPIAWPVLALTGGPQWYGWLALTGLAALVALMAMAWLHQRFLAHPPLESRATPASDRPSLFARALSAWLPLAPPAAVGLEADVATHRGLISEALVEGGMLLGSLLLLVALAPQLYARSFTDGFRFLGGLLTLLMTTPAASVAREGAGVTLRMTLPAWREDLLLAKVPVIAFRNVLLILPAALALAAVLPRATPMKVAAGAVLLALIALVGALAAVGAGMLVAPLAEGPTSFGRQVVALVMCGLTLAPLTLVSTLVNPYQAAAGVMACGLMVAGLWQKALARLAELSHPLPALAPGTLLGDAALGALLYVLGGTSLVTLMQGATGLDPDRAMLLATLLLQLMVIRYAVGYLGLRRKWSGEPYALSGGAADWALGAVLGLGCAGLAMGYGRLLTEYFDVDARSGGGPISKMVGELRDYPLEGLCALVAGGLFAPISEELLFRRLIFAGLLEATRRMVPSVVLSALFFAIVHPAPGFPMIFLVGCVSAGLYARRRTLAASVAFHMAFNCAQLGIVYYIGK